MIGEKWYALGIMFILVGFASAHAQEENYSHHNRMMDVVMHESGFMGFFGWVFMVLIIISLVLLIIWLIKKISEK